MMRSSLPVFALLSLNLSGCLGVLFHARLHKKASAAKKPLPEVIEPVIPLSLLRWSMSEKDAHPPKVAWRQEPVWEPVRENGLVVARKSANAPLLWVDKVELQTMKGQERKFICSWVPAEIQQHSLDNLGMTFQEGGIVLHYQTEEKQYIDCADYAALPGR